MKKEVGSGMEVLPTIVRSETVGIPTKTLNTVQQKNYRDYADKVCINIKAMLEQIKNTVLDDLKTSNIDKVRNEIIAANPEIKEITKELSGLSKKIETVVAKSLKIMTDYEFAKAKLTAEMETKIASLKSDEMLPLIETFEEIKGKANKAAQKNKAFCNPIESGRLRIISEKQYSYEDEDNDASNVYTGKLVRNLEVAYPSLSMDTFTENSFVDASTVRVKLEELMAPAINEFRIAEVKLEAMEQNVKEIMMFDENQMNEAFQKLFAFRNSIQQKHLAVVRKINYNINEE